MSVLDQPSTTTDRHGDPPPLHDAATIDLRLGRDSGLHADNGLPVLVTPAPTPPRTADDRMRSDAPQADRIHITERMVVAPLTGPFTPSSSCTLEIGATINHGTHIGDIAGTAVTSPFTGRIGGQLASHGERVRYGQPLLWLRPIT